jgi:hypothetical protein
MAGTESRDEIRTVLDEMAVRHCKGIQGRGA